MSAYLEEIDYSDFLDFLKKKNQGPDEDTSSSENKSSDEDKSSSENKSSDEDKSSSENKSSDEVIDYASFPRNENQSFKGEEIDYDDFIESQKQSPKDKSPKSALSLALAIHTSASTYRFLSPPSPDTSLPSSCTHISSSLPSLSSPDKLSILAKRKQTKTAVHLALSNNGSGDSLWIYDNDLFSDLLNKWNGIKSNPLHKAIKLLDSHLGIDNSPHCLVIRELKKQYDRKEIQTIYNLLEKLIAIKREDPKGLLQTIIAVIASKTYPELFIDSDEKEVIRSFSL